MDAALMAVLVWGVGLMAVTLFLGKQHEEGRRFAPLVRRGLFWACAFFVLAFTGLLLATGVVQKDAANFVLGLVAGYFALIFIQNAGGPMFNAPGRFPFSARVML